MYSYKVSRFAIILSMVIVALVLIVPGVGAQGSASSIKVTSNTGAAQFAKELKFELKAESSAADIQRVDLFYTFGDGKATNRLPTEFTPGKSVTATATKRVQQGEFAPQLDITYWWRITDAAGNSLNTDKQVLVFSDDRFQWQKAGNDKVTVFWYNESEQKGQEFLQWATEGLNRLETRFGIKMSYPVHAVIYKNKEDMALALSPRGATFDAGATILGEARSAYGTTLMINQGDTRTTMWHELTHLVLHDLVKGPYESNLVAWLDEGLAMINESDEKADSYSRALDQAIQRNDVFIVRSMTSANGVPSKVGIWYGQARSVVNLLITNHGGKEKLLTLLNLLATGTRIDPALRQVYGFDQDQLNNMWRESVGLPPQAAPGAPAVPRRPPCPGQRRSRPKRQPRKRQPPRRPPRPQRRLRPRAQRSSPCQPRPCNPLSRRRPAHRAPCCWRWSG
jgi:hypothetical protein